MSNKLFLNEVDTQIKIDCGESIADATTLRIYYLKPTGESGYWTGTLSGTTAISYMTLAGDIDCAGNWKLQSYVVMPGHPTGIYGDIVTTRVYPTL